MRSLRLSLTAVLAFATACTGEEGLLDPTDGGPEDRGLVDGGPSADAEIGLDAAFGLDAGAPDTGGPDAACPAASSGEAGEVSVAQGRLVPARGDGAVELFFGVPFAAPPLGARRFAPPEPPACYDAPRPSREPPECPQLDAQGRAVGDEDCLYLNVYKPAAAAPLRPVLVFIHGGGNAQGSSVVRAGGQLLYDGAPLAQRHDVVLVTIQYRLSHLGWLVHPELDAAHGVPSGTLGLLDQIAALRWLRENIAAFGGDPERLVIFGESAGARNVCALVASPLAAGLFSGAIMQSGTCLAPARAAVAAESAEVVRAAGCSGAAEGEIACLRSRTPAELLAAAPPVISVSGPGSALQPHADGRVLHDVPRAVIQAGAHNRIPLIIGANADETSRSLPPVPDEAAYERLVRTFAGRAADLVLARYPLSDFASPLAAATAVTSDARFICGSREDARAMAAGQTQPVFRYFFTQGLSNAPRLREFGAWHGLELLFLFERLHLGGYRASPEEQTLSLQMGAYWTSFAGAGDPNGRARPTWEVYEGRRDHTLELTGEGPRMLEGVRTEHCDFWASLIGP